MNESAEIVIMLIIYGVIFAISLGIMAFICYLVAMNFKAIPEEHRKITPGQVWLLMIPLFNLVWNFFVYPKLAQSYKSYFESIGRTDVGDCDEKIGMWYCIIAACCIIPCVGYIAGPASLVLLIIFLVKSFGYKAQVEAGGGAPPLPPRN